MAKRRTKKTKMYRRRTSNYININRMTSNAMGMTVGLAGVGMAGVLGARMVDAFK